MVTKVRISEVAHLKNIVETIDKDLKALFFPVITRYSVCPES